MQQPNHYLDQNYITDNMRRVQPVFKRPVKNIYPSLVFLHCIAITEILQSSCSEATV